MIHWIQKNTLWGTILLVEEDGILSQIHLTNDLANDLANNLANSLASTYGEPCLSDTLLLATRQIEEYLLGKRQTFQIPFRLRGTPFQQNVWKALLEIPYGQTISYKSLAKKAGSPRGFRAVAMANHRNPLPLIVPCHRVVHADGTLGGFAAGILWKKRLLDLEKSSSIWKKAP